MKKHEHSGCTRRTFGDPGRILSMAGITKGAAVMLDVGAGTGYLSIAAAELMGPGSKVYAVDTHADSVRALEKELAEKRIGNVTAMIADAAKNIPLPPDSVDICLMSNVVHGFAANGEIGGVLKNIGALLKNKGALFIIEFKKGLGPFTLCGPPSRIRISPVEMEKLVTPYGYAPRKVFNAGVAHYGIVFEKTA